MEKTFKTRPEKPLYKGAPLGLYEMLLKEIQHDDNVAWRDAPTPELPPLEKKAPVITHTITTAYAFTQQICTLANSVVHP